MERALRTIPYCNGLITAAILAVLMAPPAACAQTTQSTMTVADAVADGAKLRLQWELQRTAGQVPSKSSPARFVLTNGDVHPLPARGWSVYFNCLDRFPAGLEAHGIVVEQVAGYLFRLRPGASFRGLAPGQTVEIAYQHNDSVYMPDKAPTGPYLVYDAAPDKGVPVGFSVEPLKLPVQVAQGSGPHAGVSPQDTYHRNARIDALPASAVPLVLPTPLELQAGAGRLSLAGQAVIQAPKHLEAEASLARSLFASTLRPGRGPVVKLSVGQVEGQASPEAYRLTIQADSGIAIVGNSAAGVAYGLQTLRDLMPLPGADDAGVPELTVVDAPRFGHRGLMLDVARNFQSKQTVFKWLDLMARFKLNKFHFHLTDDEGWRLDIAGLPELTSIGAVRGHASRPGVRLQPAYGSGADPGNASGSGHYTRADYIEILRYAKARHIDVIPEIEMPGHARAAVQAMEARYHRLKTAQDRQAARFLLNDLEDRSVYESAQMYTDNVINPGLESSYTFIEHVVEQVVAMHREAGVPLSTIHMGGDELPDGAWEQSPISRAMMARHKLETTADLWDYFYGRVDKILGKHGLKTSGWEEMAVRKTMLDGRSILIPNPRFTQHGFTAYVWNNKPGAEDLANRLANAGYDVVLTPVTRTYLDMAHNANPIEHGINWGGYVDLDTVYDFIPLDMNKNGLEAARSGKDRLTEYGKRRVLGIQANLFSETVTSAGRIDHLAMPRLIALAERAWAADPLWAQEADPARAEALHRNAWSGFVHAVGQRVLPRLDLERTGIAYRIAPPGLVVEQGRVLANHVLPGTTLRYTSDGSVPNASSPQVTGPIAQRGLIRVAAFDRNGRMGQAAAIDNR